MLRISMAIRGLLTTRYFGEKTKTVAADVTQNPGIKDHEPVVI